MEPSPALWKLFQSRAVATTNAHLCCQLQPRCRERNDNDPSYRLRESLSQSLLSVPAQLHKGGKWPRIRVRPHQNASRTSTSADFAVEELPEQLAEHVPE